MEMYDSLQTRSLLGESDFVSFHESLPPILFVFVCLDFLFLSLLIF